MSPRVLSDSPNPYPAPLSIPFSHHRLPRRCPPPPRAHHHPSPPRPLLHRPPSPSPSPSLRAVSPGSEFSMETLASAMQRENRRFKPPSSSYAAGSLGRAPLVIAFLSCLAWLYIAGRYAPTRLDPNRPLVLGSIEFRESFDVNVVKHCGDIRGKRRAFDANVKKQSDEMDGKRENTDLKAKLGDEISGKKEDLDMKLVKEVNPKNIAGLTDSGEECK